MKLKDYLMEAKDDVVASMKVKGKKYELKRDFRWGGLLTHIIYIDGKEVAQEAPNLDPKIAIKRFKENVKSGEYLNEKKEKLVKRSKCCGGKVVFNNATGDSVCSICRNPVKKGDTYMSESEILNEGQHTVKLNTMEVRAIYFALFHMKETDKSKISMGSKKFDEMLRKFDAGRASVHAVANTKREPVHHRQAPWLSPD